MEKLRGPCLIRVLALCATTNVFVGATSIVPFFSDAACQDSNFTGQINQQAFSGTCQTLSHEANIVDPSHLDSCCAVTVYNGPYCSNNPTLAPNGTCTSLGIGSYSVDCPCVPSASPQSASAAASSTSTSSTSVSLISKNPPASSSSTSMATAVSPSATSTSTQVISPSSSITHSTDPSLSPSSSSQSSPPSSSTSAASKSGGDSGGGNGLSVPAQIAIGVILPSLGLIAAVIFGVRMWPRR